MPTKLFTWCITKTDSQCESFLVFVRRLLPGKLPCAIDYLTKTHHNSLIKSHSHAMHDYDHKQLRCGASCLHLLLTDLYGAADSAVTAFSLSVKADFTSIAVPARSSSEPATIAAAPPSATPHQPVCTTECQRVSA